MSGKAPIDWMDDIASSVIMADIKDKPGLAQLMTQIEEFRKTLPENAAKSFVAMLDMTIGTLQDIILDDTPSAESSLAEVSRAVTELQSAMKDDEIPIEADGAVETGKEKTVDDGVFVLPEWVDEDMFNEFIVTQKLVLDEIESDILDLEQRRNDGAAALRRKVHTMKGEAGVVGLEDLSEVCHAIEDLLDTDTPVKQKVDRLLQVKDWIVSILESYAEAKMPELSAQSALAMLQGEISIETVEKSECPEEEKKPEAVEKETVGEKPQDAASDGAEELASEVVDRDEETLVMIGDFIQESEEGLSSADEILMTVESEGADDEKINGLFRVFHSIKGVAGFLELAEITSLAHSTETMLNKVRQGNLTLEGVILDLVFDSTEMMGKMLVAVRNSAENNIEISHVDGLEKQLAKLDDAIAGKAVREQPIPIVKPDEKIGEVLIEAGITEEKYIEKALESQKKSGKKLGEELVAQGAAKPKQVAQALRAQNRSQASSKLKETVKVDLDRVDNMVEMIGELVIVESMVVNSDEIVKASSIKLRDNINQLNKITRDLQNVGMLMRMVPVRGLFQKMARMVRDLSRKNGKDIMMVQSGETTEMDRSMVEQISDPLVHMIRNAVDHGIEDNDERIAAGRTDKGKVHLSAYHEGGSIVIEISDNGRGLDKEKILAKAIKQGLVKEGERPSDQELFNLIFAPGFSTAKKVTEISGRGVGMDVVKRNIEGLRGRIITESEVGVGTTFKLVLPLTLAIIDGMLVSAGNERYIVPTLSIIESIQPEPSMIKTLADSAEILHLRGSTLPILRLDQLFDVRDAVQEPTKAIIVVLESFGHTFGLMVDEVLTQQQVVIKRIGAGIDRMEFVSGASILSNGHVGLILNIEEISTAISQGRYLRKKVEEDEQATIAEDFSVEEDDSKLIEEALENAVNDTRQTESNQQ